MSQPYPQVPHGHRQKMALPLFDLFLDLPHPSAAKGTQPPVILKSPATSTEMEKELNANLSRIGRFAFPEFDDAISQNVPRDTTLNRFSQYAMQPKTFQQYTFSLQLQSGVRIHGHVRRSHPVHPGVKTRFDVGRRGERALVLLTRSNGGDLVYSAILKTVDAITFQKSALDPKYRPHDIQPEQWFLNKMFDQHRHLCIAFASLPQQDRKPMVLTIDSLEAGVRQIPLIEQADNSKFLIPTSLLAPSSTIEAVTSSSILPLLRVLGLQNTLRLLSALLSESRILLVSSSPTRLGQCARSALSILAQGLLNWQHLYIPVLPPHLFQYLAAPVPYLIGILNTMMPRLDQARSDGLGEMVIINLDTVQMETRGINPAEVAKKIPDLFRSVTADQGMPANTMSAPELLAQDLVDLLKVDKRSLYGESALSNVSETAAKATKAMKAGFSKLKERGKKFLKNRASSNFSAGSGSDEDGEAVDPDAQAQGNAVPQNTSLPDYIYTQGSQNEVAEEEARIAFSSFFLSMYGNMRWYLAANPGQLPQLDRQRFLQQKRAMGEGEYSPIWPLLENFCETQMFEQFAKSRVEEVRNRLPVTSDSPLFTQCSNYHRMHNVDFSVLNVRRVTRQVAQNNPSRTILLTQARRTTMLLTSNKTYDGDYNQAVAQLVEQCRESSSVLFDVMSVIWVRLRDSKGLHWKHGFQALQILRNLLYHGPLAAIAEATDGLDKIRVMKFYNDNMRSQICTQIRQVAQQVYNLLVDRAKLYAIRRMCINKRRLLRKQDQMRYVKDTRMTVMTPFGAIHKTYNPMSAKVAPMPGTFAPIQTSFAAEQDLLGFGSTAATTTSAPLPSTAAQDLAGLFGANLSVSAVSAPTSGNPFDSIPAQTASAPSQAVHGPGGSQQSVSEITSAASIGASQQPTNMQEQPRYVPQVNQAEFHSAGNSIVVQQPPAMNQQVKYMPHGQAMPLQHSVYQSPYGVSAQQQGQTHVQHLNQAYQHPQYQQPALQQSMPANQPAQAYAGLNQQQPPQQQYQINQQPHYANKSPPQQQHQQQPPQQNPNISQFDPFK